jgi:hypothetical protein
VTPFRLFETSIVLGMILLTAVLIDNTGSLFGWIDFTLGSIMVIVGAVGVVFL